MRPQLLTVTHLQRFVANTVTNVKRLIGRKFKEEDVQRELPYLAYKVVEQPDGDCGIQVKHNGVVKTFTPVQICGALLGQLKKTAQDALGTDVRDVVLSVPHWWNDRQRRALMDAAAVANLNCVQLINELTGCALELGIRKDKTLADKQSDLVCFFDMGDTQTQCAVMRYSKGKLEVLGYGYDHHLGGRNFTAAIADHFAAEWKAKYKIDVNSNARARMRVVEASQNLKHVLSSNAQGVVNLDCLLNDKDVSGKLERDQFQVSAWVAKHACGC
jgi:molecular chaperone DnaK (HSP70)